MLDSYYTNLIRGKSKSWIDVYVMNRLGAIQDGKPIYNMFVHDTHVAQEEIPVADVARCATRIAPLIILFFRPSGALADCANCLALLAIIQPPVQPIVFQCQPDVAPLLHQQRPLTQNSVY